MRAWRIALMAMEGLRRSPLRAVLTTLGVTIAASALLTMVALAVGVQRQVETPFKALGLLNNIQVTAPDGKDKSKAVVPLDDAALERMQALPGVAIVWPEAHLKGIKIRRGDKEATAIGVAMPREAGLLGVEEEILIAGKFFGETPQPEVILGAQLARNLGFATPQEAVGQEVMLEAAGLTPGSGQSFTFQRKQLAVKVAGVYDVPAVLPGPAHGGIILPVEMMRDIPGMFFESAMNRLRAGDKNTASGYGSVTVRVRKTSDLVAVSKQIEAMGFKTRTMLSRLQGMQKFFIAIELLLTVVGAVAMIIAALGIVNTLLISVLERFQEIGVCKAVGASDGDIFILFLTEAGIIGLIGGLSGLVLGWATALGLEAIATQVARRWEIEGRLGLFGFPIWLLLGTALFAVVMSMLAGIYPALRAARLDPIRALRSH